ncbi:Thioesterase/thiol ester dehydrase-isomerase [Schizopora paradoxa]|uniref:Thioesterase/thiol ester dehydrase-isomerase n=1 Tax=Schizopora paradoxa TaxID=27342 RepID=A0A0H2RUZ5_9AGAM|nr:Thioesterase/thiol ester dehydrase-isomerase [Schizopora paradoxa]
MASISSLLKIGFQRSACTSAWRPYTLSSSLSQGQGYPIPSRYFSSSCTRGSRNSVSQLQNAFKDPSSPFYLEPGTEGPADPGAGFINPEKVHLPPVIMSLTETVNNTKSPQTRCATLWLKGDGNNTSITYRFDPTSYYEEIVNWGDMDAFQHVNNVRYVRYLESGRIVWMYHLALELGGPILAKDMISGRGVSLILKDISVRYRRPVTFPDTLLIAHRPHDSHPTHFSSAGIIWSYAQQTIVATSDSTLVWYDYDRLKKCDPGEAKRAILEKKIEMLSNSSFPTK